jgi:hypothetical protein
MASGFEKDQELKKAAGVERLNSYSNYLELQTLCDFLNCDHEKILESDDYFCTKILLCNLERLTFENKFAELKRKQKGK